MEQEAEDKQSDPEVPKAIVGLGFRNLGEINSFAGKVALAMPAHLRRKAKPPQQDSTNNVEDET